MLPPRLILASSILLVSLAACGDNAGESRGNSDSASASVGSVTNLTLTAGTTSGPTSASASDGSGSNSESASDGVTTSTSGDPASTGGGSNNSEGLKFDLGVAPDVNTGCGGMGGGGMADTSYIWIPATSDGTVSKINTRTLVEEARYATGPSGGTESVSRTAVSGDGRFVVINSRGTGRSTAVAASIDDCKDKNGDGVITTSAGPADVKGWDQDECVVWSVVHPTWSGSYTHGPRGITWTLGEWNEATCSFVNPKVWVGFLSGNGAGHLVRLDGVTGTQEALIEAPGWDGQGYAPYGGALDPQQRPWFTGLRGELVRVNTDQDPITLTRIPQPGGIQSYGMTVDPFGNPWMAGCSGPVSVYDLNLQNWISVGGTNGCHRGMAIDHDNHGWIANNGPCELVEIDTVTRTLVAKHNLAQCSTPIGVSVDVDGYVWLVDQEGWAWKIDPKNVPAMQMIPVAGSHYVYSDMTGGQLKSVSQPPG